MPSIDMTTMPDAGLTLITLAPLLPQPIQITGLSTLHHKECDRLLRPAEAFAELGIVATTTEDSITVNPVDWLTLQPITLNTHHDHRMAMAFSMLGSVSGTLTIDDPQVVDKTYPHYWQDYQRLVN